MTDEELERRYGATSLPTAAEVLAGQTQGGVAPPSGFFTLNEMTALDQPPPKYLTVEQAQAGVERATQSLVAAQSELWNALLRSTAKMQVQS